MIAQNFIACDREQELLLPPSLRAWWPEGHLAWFVLDAPSAGGGYSGQGHTTWEHDEPSITHWYGIDAGAAGRQAL